MSAGGCKDMGTCNRMEWTQGVEADAWKNTI